ncbi:hypothetical protein [Nocardioides pelophilus]|uniref:hypothetical protein n=1 Tax=Nocardioides pelophilus TaxID=2172019 RepID=UPI0016038400|nr:hypothetical protein [Nocardioides pelophilus]
MDDSSGDLYVIWGYVAGTVLPPNITSGDTSGDNWFRITQDVPESFKRLDPPGIVEARMSSGTWVTGIARRTRAHSRAVFQVPVRVDHPDDAMPAVEREVLPNRLAAISAIAGSPLVGVPLAFHAAGEPEAWLPRRSDAEVHYFAAQQHDAEAIDSDEAAGVIWAAEHDYTARRAAADMYRGNHRLYSHADDPADVRAALLTYFFVLERISDRIERFYPLRPASDEMEPLIDNLEVGLDHAESVADKVQAVKVAAQKLQALHSRGMHRRVKEAGRTFGLDEDVTRTAGELTDLRNSTLGHVPKAEEQPAELLDWLPKAQRCAHMYLSAYLHWVNNRGVAARD